MDRHPTVGGIEDLLERSGELARIDELIAIATGGDGRFLVIQGRSGIGKTALLAALTRRARRAGMSVYTARCSELEADFAFGTVRQLFEPVVQVMDDDRAEGALVGAAALAGPVVGATEAVTAGGQFAALHGLYWLAADLSARSPLVLAVDDVQWSDLPSLRWLSYLLLRLEGLPILVAVTARVVRSGGQASVLARIMAQERVDLMELAPLGEQSIAALLSAALADEPEPAFTAACRRATDGNPFALQSVIRELATRRVRPIATSASALEYAPAPIARRVIASLTELGEPGRRLASAVAVLGDGAELRLVAELTDLDEATAASIADRLTAADLLANEHPLRFRHPLLRAAVYDDVPLALRSQLHRRAADLLAREQAEPEAIAAHVLRTDPMEEAAAVQRLRAAAAVALGRGAPEAATAYLRRALAEPPGRGTRAGLLAELGKAELVAGDRRAVEHLEQAIAECPDPVARATVRGNLAEALRAAGQRRRSLHERLTALQEIGDREPEVAARLEVRVVSMRFTARYAATDVEPAQRLRELARDGGAAARLARLACALRLSQLGESSQEVLRFVDWGLEGGVFLSEETSDSPGANWAAYALIFADELDRARGFTTAVLEDAAGRGSFLGFVYGSIARARAELRSGLLSDAGADAQAALDVAWEREISWLPHVAAWQAGTLLELGQIGSADVLLERVRIPEGLAGDISEAEFLGMRGRVRCANGRSAEGIADLRACGATAEALKVRSPVAMPWRSELALVLAAEASEQASEEARALAEADLREARRTGLPRGIGVALRTAAALAAGGDRVELLTEAVTALERSPGVLELARALVDLGVVLHRSGHRIAAREPLRRALDLATGCGAVPLAERAHAEALVAGARPRRPRIQGVHALTPGELRVARLAAEGRSNREIAQALFITSQTAKDHLNSTYSKLDITSRKELATALAQTPQ